MGPEKIIQIQVEQMLRRRGWYVKRTHGGMYQSGFPDDFATHPRHGHRWIEIKLPELKGSKFTKAQLEVFADLCKNGSGVWIMTAATDAEYSCLFQQPNWAVLMHVYKR